MEVSLKIVITHDENKSKYACFENTITLTSFHELKQISDIDWILVDWDIVDDIEQFIVELRTTTPIHYKPLFLNQPNVNNTLQLLVDGISLTEIEMDKTAQQINQKISDFKEPVNSEDLEGLLLMFMLTRNNKNLNFELAPELPQKVRYPLMEIYIKDPLLAKKRVDALVDEKILTPHKVSDEIQLCPSCHNGWLNFKNVCPICRSVDIEKIQFIHCFSCGNTEPEQNFMTNDALICLNCHTKLKHIGIEYDKPLEEYVCKDNHHRFMDSELECHCFSCDESFSTQRVISKKLASYKVSNKGINYLIHGKGLAYVDLKDVHNFLDESVFTLFLNWFIQAAQRYDVYSFSVCNIHVTNYHNLVEKHGMIGTKQLIHEFFNSLRSFFRSTDLITRLDDEVATIIFSQSNTESFHAIERNIRLIQENTKHNAAISIQINAISSDSIDLSEFNAAKLLSELKI